MNDPTALPRALYEANAELQARVGELLQNGGQHWFEFGQRLLEHGLGESSTEWQQLLHTQDWQKLAALPADAFWRQLQQRFGDQQAATQLAVAAQAAFARGLQDALQDWQQQTTRALDAAGLAIPALDPGWAGLFRGWEPVLPVVATVAVAPTAARTPAAAAKKSAPKKATPGKTAVKQAAKATKTTKKTAKKAAPAAKPAKAAKKVARHPTTAHAH